MGMDHHEQRHIERQLTKYVDDDEWLDLTPPEQYSKMQEVYNALPYPVTDWALVELIDAVTFEKKLYWRKKS